jgi:hypothetical protein
MNAICFLIMVSLAIIGRVPVAWLGSRIGIVTRHTVGFFTAFLSGGVTVQIGNFVTRPERFFRD